MSEALNNNGLYKMQECLVPYRPTPFHSHLFCSDTTHPRLQGYTPLIDKMSTQKYTGL